MFLTISNFILMPNVFIILTNFKFCKIKSQIAKSLAITIWEITNRLLNTNQQNVKHCADYSLNIVVCLHINA